jgi:glutamate 5-kinase
MERKKKKHIIIKIGRAIAITKRGKLDLFRMEQLIKQIRALHSEGIGVIVIISAAVSVGKRLLKSTHKELLGSLGQAEVTSLLFQTFAKHGLLMGQLLVTKHDFQQERKRKTIIRTLKNAIEYNVVTVVNENDALELHSFSGNDYLASELAKLMKSDQVVFMTDIEGVLDKEKRVMKLMDESERFSVADIIKRDYRGEVGGMQSKIDAALFASREGITSWIVHGKTQDLLTRIVLNQEHIGTKITGGMV